MTESNQKRDLKFERQLKNGGVEKQRSAGTGCSGIGQKGSSPSDRVQIAFTTDTKAKTNLMSYVFVQCHVLVLLGAFQSLVKVVFYSPIPNLQESEQCVSYGHIHREHIDRNNA